VLLLFLSPKIEFFFTQNKNYIFFPDLKKKQQNFCSNFTKKKIVENCKGRIFIFYIFQVKDISVWQRKKDTPLPLNDHSLSVITPEFEQN
jgi:hypothetical protein